MKRFKATDDWDDIAYRMKRHQLQSSIAEYKKKQHINLLNDWVFRDRRPGTILKTDAFEEAFCSDSFFQFMKANSQLTFAIDISKSIVENAKENQGFDFIRASVTDIPCKRNTIDLIVSNSTLDHLTQTDFIRALEELARIIRDNGILVLTLDNAHNPSYRLGYNVRKFFGGHYHQEKCYYKDEVLEILDKKGFEVEEVRSLVHLPTPFNLLANLFSPIDDILLNLPTRGLIGFLDHFGLGGKNLTTGWFLAFKCKKKGI